MSWSYQHSGVKEFLKEYQVRAEKEKVDPLGYYLPPYSYALLQVLGQAVEATKGGLVLDIHGLRGFLPISRIELERVEDLQPYLGQKLRCTVEEVDRAARKVVVSTKLRPPSAAASRPASCATAPGWPGSLGLGKLRGTYTRACEG